MSDKTVILITGSNRGIGLGFVQAYLARPNHIVVAAVRDLARAEKAFESLTPEPGSNLITVRIDSNDRESLKAAVEELQQQKGIDHLDIVIANAALNIPKSWTDLSSVDVDTIHDHVEVNAIAPFLLYRATRPLLDKSRSKNGPIFAPISSITASLGGFGVLSPQVSYGTSKAALNLLFVSVQKEIWSNNGEIKASTDYSNQGQKGVPPFEVVYQPDNEGKPKDRLAILLIHPGAVMTDMLEEAANGTAPPGSITIEHSVESMVKLLDEATQQTHGGKFFNYKGAELEW